MKRLLLILFVLIVPFIWAQSMIPPQYWQEHWYEHNQLLTRQDFTANSVVYYDNDMDPTITWPLQRTSKMWGHAKATYGQSGSDPRLYVILHSGKYLGGHLAYYYEESHDYRNVMDIGQSGSWEEPTGWNIDFIAYLMCIIIESAGTNIRYSPAAGVWHNKFTEIFTYDMYNTLGWTSEAERVKANFSSNIDDFPREGTQWFKDWFYPIYTEYGGSTVLGKFFNLMASRLPKDSLGNDQYAYTRGLTLGEIIHFWSGAAGKDLKDLALSAFGTLDEQGNDWRDQLVLAKSNFPRIGYEKRRLRRCRRAVKRR